MSTLSAALPGAALRVTRTAVGRRALQVGLLIGGLFVLGLLCGERAYAAEGATPGVRPTEVVRSVTGSAGHVVTRSVGAVVKGAEKPRAQGPSSEQWAGQQSAESNGSRPSGPFTSDAAATPDSASAPAPSATPDTSESDSQPGAKTPSHPRTVAPLAPVHKVTAPVTDGVHRVIRPVTERVVRPVTEQVVQPVTERVVRPASDGVVRPIGGLVEQVVGGGLAEPPASPWWPPRSEFPELPGLPVLPLLPELPGPPVLPGETLPVGSEPQLPGGAAEESAAAGHGAAGQSGDGYTGAYGPQFTGGHAAPDAGARDDGEGPRGAQPPANPAPKGDPTGALGHGSAADNGSPRHGDAHAVAFDNRAQPKLMPGTTAAVTAAETRDRHRDIPVFPG